MGIEAELNVLVTALTKLRDKYKREAAPPDPPRAIHEAPRDGRSAHARNPIRPDECYTDWLRRIARIEKQEGAAVWESDLRRAADAEVRRRRPPRRPSWALD